MVEINPKALRSLHKLARRYGVAKAEALRMQADARRWYSDALRAGNDPAAVQIVVESDRPGHCRMAVVVADDPGSAPVSATVH